MMFIMNLLLNFMNLLASTWSWIYNNNVFEAWPLSVCSLALGGHRDRSFMPAPCATPVSLQRCWTSGWSQAKVSQTGILSPSFRRLARLQAGLSCGRFV